MTDEVEYLKQRVIKWCDAIRTKKRHGYEAWYCLTSTIMKTLECLLVATSLTRDQIDDIMKPLCKIALNLCNLQKNLPKHLLYGPIEERGCGLKDPYYLLLAYHLFTILKHQARDTATRDLLDENMDCIQYYIGWNKLEGPGV